MNQTELDNIIKAHAEYLADDTTGYKAYLYGANLRGANLRGANLTGAYLYGANLTGAYLYEANLTEADLRGANLTGANLTGANLTGANLTEADLRGAYLHGTDIFQFQAGKFNAFYHIASVYPEGNYLRIGCKGHSLSHWLEHGREIGEQAGFAETEIDLNMLIIEKIITQIKVLP